MSVEEVFSFFHSKKIRKAQLLELQQTTYIPDDPFFLDVLEEFLGMSKLEICLAMGHIPPEYKKSYFQNIASIAQLLTKDSTLDNERIYKPYFENDFGKLYHADCIEVMKNMSDCCIDLIFADPPFNLGKTYDPGVDDNMSMSMYINWTYEWLDECIRILKPGGRIFVYNLPKWCVYVASHLSKTLTFWDWIAVDMKFNLPIQNRLYPAHYALVAFVKGIKARTFNNQRIPLQTCRHCGGELKDYGGYKSKMNPMGVNVSDVWSDIYPVRHKSIKNRRYNELSVKLLARIISMATDEGNIVFDPFGGSGTTYAVAQILKRNWIGCELGDCDIIKNRLLNPSRDKEQLEKIKEETDCLFTQKAEQLRKKNGFWTCERTNGISPASFSDQLSSDMIDKKDKNGQVDGVHKVWRQAGDNEAEQGSQKHYTGN